MSTLTSRITPTSIRHLLVAFAASAVLAGCLPAIAAADGSRPATPELPDAASSVAQQVLDRVGAKHEAAEDGFGGDGRKN